MDFSGICLVVHGIFFMHEIEVFVPFVLGFILALFPAFWAASVPLLRRSIFVPSDVQLKGRDAERDYYNNEKHSYWKKCLLVFALASWWCVLEWIRTWIGTGLPWNLLAVSQWKNISLLQICEFTGVYGLSFVLIHFNISLRSRWISGGTLSWRRNTSVLSPSIFQSHCSLSSWSQDHILF